MCAAAVRGVEGGRTVVHAPHEALAPLAGDFLRGGGFGGVAARGGTLALLRVEGFDLAEGLVARVLEDGREAEAGVSCRMGVSSRSRACVHVGHGECSRAELRCKMYSDASIKRGEKCRAKMKGRS
jgi:hypothetical protein